MYLVLEEFLKTARLTRRQKLAFKMKNLQTGLSYLRANDERFILENSDHIITHGNCVVHRKAEK